MGTGGSLSNDRITLVLGCGGGDVVALISGIGSDTFPMPRQNTDHRHLG